MQHDSVSDCSCRSFLEHYLVVLSRHRTLSIFIFMSIRFSMALLCLSDQRSQHDTPWSEKKVPGQEWEIIEDSDTSKTPG